MRWFLQVVLFCFFITSAGSLAYPETLTPEQLKQLKRQERTLRKQKASEHFLNSAEEHNRDWMNIHLAEGASFDSADSKGQNALHRASQSKNANNLPWLLGQMGHSHIRKLINAKDDNGMTPLDYAQNNAFLRHHRVANDGVSFLLKNGADPDQRKNKKGPDSVEGIISDYKRKGAIKEGAKIAIGGVAVAAVSFFLGRRTLRSQSF